MREQSLVTKVLTEIRKLLPFPLLGFDTDNDSVFINDTVRDYCLETGVSFSRCRPYRKNDQAWVEQKNGAIVRRIVGYRRVEGLRAAAVLAELYTMVRRFVNLFQPSFKLAEKDREGARVRKRYHPPATPHQSLMADPRTRTRQAAAPRAPTRRSIRCGCFVTCAPTSSAWSTSPIRQRPPTKGPSRPRRSRRSLPDCGPPGGRERCARRRGASRRYHAAGGAPIRWLRSPRN